MSWMRDHLPMFRHQQKQSEQSEKEETKIKPSFTVGMRVCFHRSDLEGDVCGIGIIKKLQSTPVMNSGKIIAFTYVADIQPVYVPSYTWELRPVGDKEHSSDDSIITFPLSVVAILFGRLSIRTRLREAAGGYELLSAVPGEYFCRADYHETLRLCCGKQTALPSVHH